MGVMSVPPLKMFEAETERRLYVRYEKEGDWLHRRAQFVCLKVPIIYVHSAAVTSFTMLVFWHGSVPRSRVQSVPLVKNLSPVTKIS